MRQTNKKSPTLRVPAAQQAVDAKKLVVLAVILASSWFIWALIRPELGVLSPRSEAQAMLAARLVCWICPSAIYLARTHGVRWSDPLGLRFPYGPQQLVRAIALPLFLAFLLIVGTSRQLDRPLSAIVSSLASGLRLELNAPIIEELVFRGVVASEALTWAREGARNYPSLLYRFWVALTGSAFLFASVHVPYLADAHGIIAAISPLISLFVTGIVLGFVFAQTRSIYGCIFLHLLNNELSKLA